MNQHLALNKEDYDKLIQKIAEMILERMSFNPEELIVIPTATVAQCTGESPRNVQRRFPITTISKQKQGVIMKTLRVYLENNTRPPKA